MSTGATTKRTYPWTTTLKNKSITFRLMERRDKDMVLRFTQNLPQEDLLFLAINVTDPTVVEQWLNSIEHNQNATVLVELEGRFVGYGSLSYNQIQWTRHLGEIRLLIGRDVRGLGVGKLLVNEVFVLAQELGLSKLVAHMASDQKGAVQVFEHLGFKPEALLADHVIDRNDRTHDLVVMSYDVDGFSEE